MNALAPKFEISADDITTVVHEFYRRVRLNATLAPVFETALSNSGHDWFEHEEKIIRFWANAILHERNYNGNPMKTHMDNHSIEPSHFEIWLNLFEATVHDKLSQDKAIAFDHLARRIGKGLRMGVEDLRRPFDQVPVL